VKVCITGVAGFIGSNVAARLLSQGVEVIGVDVFTDYYDRKFKDMHLAPIRDRKGFTFVESDLLDFDFAANLGSGDAIVHEAAQPGVRASWGEQFEIYTRNNVLVTQRMLESVKDVGLQKVVFAGSSSVYGDVNTFPMQETARPQPVSPYGVTKLAAEHLCMLYHHNYGLRTVSLRYFTVYGPGQRPDMAFHRFCRSILTGQPLPLFGTGKQTRDFTYIDDIVTGTVAAIEAECAGEVINVGGGSRISLEECIHIIEDAAGKKAKFDGSNMPKGDVKDTAADISKAKRLLGYDPKTPVAQGLPSELEWMKTVLEAENAG
jgi:nucleoside-diphosphate-sugar epimerase